MIDRSDAVNLAHNLRDDPVATTLDGVRCLVNAVLAMDEYIRSTEKYEDTIRMAAQMLESGNTHDIEHCQAIASGLRAMLAASPSSSQESSSYETDDECKSLSEHVQSLDAKCAELERDSGNYRWMIENPYDVLLAFSEATNQDTYGLLRDAPIPEQRMREYLITRLGELMAMSSQSDTNSENAK